MTFSESESREIQELFGALPHQLDPDTFKQKLRELRAKYHPDQFEKFGNETVKQLATERFQRIEHLADKLEAFFNLPAARRSEKPGPSAEPFHDPRARFSGHDLKIEVRTDDKDLKYHLFGTFYRWLKMGDTFKVPDTKARITADEDYLGRTIGFVETIRFYLSFEEDDPVDTIVQWLFERIDGRADALLIEGDIVPIVYEEVLSAVKRRTFKRLAAGPA
jgi:hypothetical protein